MSTDQIFKAVEELPSQDLDTFVDRVVALRAARRSNAPRLSESESELFQQINRGLSAAEQERFQVLASKLDEETLSESEHQELVALTDEIERLNLDRVESLARLAQLRGVPLESLMTQLGIGAPAHE